MKKQLSNPLPQNAIIINGTIYALVDDTTDRVGCLDCAFNSSEWNTCIYKCACINIFLEIKGKHFEVYESCSTQK